MPNTDAHSTLPLPTCRARLAEIRAGRMWWWWTTRIGRTRATWCLPRVCYAGSDQLHGQAWARAGLPGDDGGARGYLRLFP